MLRRLLLQVGTNIPVSIDIEGQDGENICFVRDVQRHPVTEDFLHVDFIRVDVSQTVSAEVPITLVGEAPSTRQGGTLLQPLQNVRVEARPMDMPASIEIDVSVLDDFEKALFVRELDIPGNVNVLTDAGEMIARVAPPRVEVEERPVDEGLEGVVEGAEAAEEEASEG